MLATMRASGGTHPVQARGELRACLQDAVGPICAALGVRGIRTYLELGAEAQEVAVPPRLLAGALAHLVLEAAGPADSRGTVTVSAARQKEAGIVLTVRGTYSLSERRIGFLEVHGSASSGVELAHRLIAPHGGSVQEYHRRALETRIVLHLPAAAVAPFPELAVPLAA